MALGRVILRSLGVGGYHAILTHMTTITVSHLTKHYAVYHKSSGFLRSFTSLFHRNYHTVKAVEDISFTIADGDLVGFIGPNGAGKTTTLKCLCGLLHPTQGNVTVLGSTPAQRKSTFLTQIALVMGQKNQLWWDLPAIDTFRLNKEIYEINEQMYDKTLDELCHMLSVERLLDTPVRQLSLGERMKMELIASLLHRPKILFLDEPTIGLDVLMQKVMRDFIHQYNQRFHATILLTSHYMRDVKELCKRIIVIDHGKIIYDGTLSKLISQYAKHKIVTAVFEKESIPTDLLAWDKKAKVFGGKVTLTISKKDVNQLARKLLAFKGLQDFTIEEPEIEDIVRIIFSKASA